MITKTCKDCKQEKTLDLFTKAKDYKDGYSAYCKVCYNARKRKDHHSNPEAKKAKYQKQRVWVVNNIEKVKEYDRNFKEKNREELNEKARQYKVENPKKIKDIQLKHYYKYHEEHKAYLRKYNVRPEVKAYKYNNYYNTDDYKFHKKGYYLTNKERIEARAKVWRERNKPILNANSQRRRARKKEAEGSYTFKDIFAIWEKQKGKCVYCRKKIGKSPNDTSSYHVDHIMPLSKGGSNYPSNLQCLCASCNLRKNAKHPIQFANEFGLLF